MAAVSPQAVSKVLLFTLLLMNLFTAYFFLFSSSLSSVSSLLFSSLLAPLSPPLVFFPYLLLCLALVYCFMMCYITLAFVTSH